MALGKGFVRFPAGENGAESARAVAQLQLLNTIRTVMLDVQNACVEVLLAKSNLALAQENLQAFNNIVEVNTVRAQAGDLAVVELERTQVAALQFENDVNKNESSLFLARTQLQTLLGRTAASDTFDVAGELRHDAQAARGQALRRLEILGLKPGDFKQQVIVRAPLAGKILEINVVPGEYRTDTTISDTQVVIITLHPGHAAEEVEQGQTEEGMAQIRQGLATKRAIGAGSRKPYLLVLLAEACGRMGQTEEGLTVVTEALDLVDKSGLRVFEAELYRLKGQLTLQKFQVSGFKFPIPNTQPPSGGGSRSVFSEGH